ncbi:hypothetical protein [Kocuria sp. cx-455]|uniref:hypothetical protein n=1 Tax=Kocuria sp. cx-455 TaxID=2771377 RepID=UPI003D7096D4
MKHAQVAGNGAPAHGVELALTVWVIPLLSAALIALGWSLLDRTELGESPLDADLAVALAAALVGVVLAAWWFTGLLMVACTAGARALRWHGVERYATRLTPQLMARTVGAVLGIQLVAVSTAHASEPIDPFWPRSESGISRAEPQQPGAHGAPSEHSATAPLETGAPDPTDPPLEPAHAETQPSPAAPAPPDVAPGHPSAAVASPEVCEQLPSPARVVDSRVTVIHGDTVWDLTAQFLGPDATSAQIAAQTTTWLEHNDLQNGGNLIRPGDQLRVPPQLLHTTPGAVPTEGATS